MKFTIYRGSWVRGGNATQDKFGESSLLNDRNRQCCLGQICSQAGIPLAYLKYIGYPDGISNYYNTTRLKEIGLLNEDQRDSREVLACVDINDVVGMPDKDREKGIKKEFESLGHKVVFKNGVAPWLQESV